MRHPQWIVPLVGVLTLVACQKPAEPEREGARDEKHSQGESSSHDEKSSLPAHPEENRAEKAGHRNEEEHAGEGHLEKSTSGEHARSKDELVLDMDALRDLRITTAVAQKRPEHAPVSALGEIRVDESRYAEVGPAIQGRVLRLLAAEGDPVKAGQSLAELESPEVGRARAGDLQANARYGLSKRTLERKRTLIEGGTVSQREVEEAEAEFTATEAELKATRATLSPMGVTEKGEGGRFTLVSPIAGQVLSRDLHLGELLAPEKAAFRVADLSHLWVGVPVFERDAVHLSPGEPAQVLPTSLPGQRLEARIARIGAEVRAESRTVLVRLELDNPGGRLKPGMSVNVQFLGVAGTSPEIVAVPLAAVQRLEERWVVFIPRGKGRFEVRTIERGRDLGGEIEVVSGLEAGTGIVADGSFVLRASATQGEGGDEHEH